MEYSPGPPPQASAAASLPALAAATLPVAHVARVLVPVQPSAAARPAALRSAGSAPFFTRYAPSSCDAVRLGASVRREKRQAQRDEAGARTRIHVFNPSIRGYYPTYRTSIPSRLNAVRGQASHPRMTRGKGQAGASLVLQPLRNISSSINSKSVGHLVAILGAEVERSVAAHVHRVQRHARLNARGREKGERGAGG